jgi:DNA-binding response OmpR family regulator
MMTHVDPHLIPRSTAPYSAQSRLSLEGPTRVLVAEDDDEMRDLIAEALRAKGYHVIEATNGPELRDWLHRAQHQEGFDPPPDLIISDVKMPGLTGLEVLSWLRQRDWSTPVILITAFGDADAHHEAERLGATLFNKPLAINSLVFAAMVLVEPR